MSKAEGPPTDLTDAKLSGNPVSVVAGLDRVFCVAGLYPEGHDSVVQATARLHECLASFLGGFPLLVIEMQDGALLVQSRPVDQAKPGAKRLATTLDALGIVRLEIDSKVPPEDLYEFSTLQRSATQKAKSARSFRVIDFKQLPSSIRVVPREFGKRKTGGEGQCFTADQLDAAVQQVMSTLRDREIGGETRAACEHLVEQVFGKVQEKLEVSSWSGPNFRQSRDRPLEKALELGVSAVQGALQTFFSEEGDSGSLADLFDLAEKAIAFSEDEGTLKLVQEVLEEAREDAGPEAQFGSDEPAADLDCTWSTEELCARIAKNEAEWDVEATLATSDACELISVCTQLLLHYPTPRSLASIRDALADCLAGWLGERERRTLRAALAAILDSANPTLIDRSLPLLLDPLRPSKQLSVGGLLLELAKDRPDLDAVLPHILNEVLRGLDVLEPETAGGLLDVVAEVSEESARDWVHRLNRLRTIRDQLIPRRLLSPPPPELRPVLAAILRSRRDSIIGLLLLDGLRECTKGSAGAEEALWLAKDGTASCRDLMLQLLAGSPGDEPSADLQSAAGRVIVERLPLLAARRRKDPIVPRAIRALGELQPPGAESALESVLTERRRGPFHAWPRPCRRAARRALRELKNGKPETEVRS